MHLCRRRQGRTLILAVALGQRAASASSTKATTEHRSARYGLGPPRASKNFHIFVPISLLNKQQARLGFTGSAIGVHGPPRGFQTLRRAGDRWSTQRLDGRLHRRRHRRRDRARSPPGCASTEVKEVRLVAVARGWMRRAGRAGGRCRSRRRRPRRWHDAARPVVRCRAVSPRAGATCRPGARELGARYAAARGRARARRDPRAKRAASSSRRWRRQIFPAWMGMPSGGGPTRRPRRCRTSPACTSRAATS